MPDFHVADLSRAQFAMTALYHFLFVPLTLGLSLLLAIMESVYVMTGRRIWRDMTMFWGILFGINFAMGVATGITMEFEFGTNWAYYSRYVGDVFGAPLAIEGLMAFFLEATFIGLFFFGWDKLSRIGHLAVTWCVAIGSNLSALWILIANGWMQNPVGSAFNYQTMRMEVTDFKAVLFNPVAQAKVVHTVSAGYVTGAIFVMAISAFYLLRGRHIELARRSITVAASFGLASALSVVVLGDESGYLATQDQKMKLAAMESMWRTEPAPAPFTVFGIPDVKNRETRYEVKAPWLLGLIATRSISQQVPGIEELVAASEQRIRSGVTAYDDLQKLRADRNDAAAQADFARTQKDLGYGLLLRRFTDDPRKASEQQIQAAAWSLVPDVPVMFFAFRAMVGIGFFQIALFAAAFFFASNRTIERQRWFLRIALLALPLPWIAAELGWVVAEYGRQPWIIEGVLPTFLGVSSISAGDVWTSIAAFVLLYSGLAAIDIFLMVKYVRIGPQEVWSVPDIGAGRPGSGGMYRQPRPTGAAGG
ncbi:MAG: cytochrome ubiquinol oxidase subunit I [Hyphomicrobiales bacterium]|nr:cytochrome ubiquinol oxidase subunit I [Hyphomicrobiales bacterium]